MYVLTRYLQLNALANYVDGINLLHITFAATATVAAEAKAAAAFFHEFSFREFFYAFVLLSHINTHANRIMWFLLPSSLAAYHLMHVIYQRNFFVFLQNAYVHFMRLN